MYKSIFFFLENGDDDVSDCPQNIYRDYLIRTVVHLSCFLKMISDIK